jgi:hypothetical protein
MAANRCEWFAQPGASLMRHLRLATTMDGKAPTARAVTSLYGEETAEFRAWVADYIVRNKDMLDLMARL